MQPRSRYQQFCDEPRTQTDLYQAAHEWLETQHGGPIQGPLKLDGRWHYIDKIKRSGYKGREGTGPHGTPYVDLVFKSFRQGGYTETFDSKEVLRELYEQFKAGQCKERIHYEEKMRERQAAREAAAKARAEREEKGKAESVARDLALWETLPTSGTSAYLKRKGLDGAQAEALRYGKGFIAALITDIDGIPRGLQKIFDVCDQNGNNKWFTKGLQKKSGFIQLGEINKKALRFIVCEGLVTGLTIRLADPATTTICALDAGNIEPVIAALRKKYGSKSKCEIVIAADNDHWKADQLNPQTGEPIGNIGLTKAHQTALKHRCRVTSPKFDSLDTSSQPTDFNDSMQLAGLEAVRAQISATSKPDPHLAFTKTREKDRKRTAAQFKDHICIKLNDRYLPVDVPDEEDGDIRLLTEIIQRHRVNIIRSPIGSGKTEVIKRFVGEAGNQSLVYISHLIALAEDAANRLGLEVYSDYKDGLNSDTYADIAEIQRLAVCLNSLPMLIRNGHTRKFDIVVIDEIEQLARRLTTKIENKGLVLQVLKYLIQSADHIILLDSHTSSVTLELLKQWLPDGQYLCILNEYRVGQGRQAIIYDTIGEIQQKAIAELKQGGKVFFAANSKRAARQTFKLLEQATGKSGLYISADNNGDDEVREFFADVNVCSRRYDFVVATPSVCTGISIDNDHFSFVAGAFNHRVNTPMDCLQALGRVRNTRTLHIAISEAKNAEPTDPETIAARWSTTHQHDLALMGISANGSLELIDADYQKICLAVTKEANFARNDFLGRFLRLLDADGYSVRYSDTTEEGAAEAKFLEQTAKEMEDEEYIQTRVEADDLNEDEAKELEERMRHTFDETRCIDKHSIKNFLSVTNPVID